MPLVFVDEITPSGTQNGSNHTFTLPQAPNPASSLDLFRNGLLLTQGVDYSLSSLTITYLLVAPAAPDVQRASYRYVRDTLPSGSLGTLNSTLLKAALRKAGVSLAPGRSPSTEQMSEAINEENRMIGGWNCNPLNIFTNRIDLWSTVQNQQSYTIGIDPTGNLTADWDGPRPQDIIRANFLLPTATDPISKVRRKLKIWTDEDWANIEYQAVYSYPEGLYFDGGYGSTNGFGTIYFRPIPNGVYQIELYTAQLIQQFETVDDTVILPPGYEDAIVNNLAVRLDTFPWTVKVPMNPQVRVDAVVSLRLIQQANISVPRLYGDKALVGSGGAFNWRSGTRD